jgi:hypothetical protein
MCKLAQGKDSASTVEVRVLREELFRWFALISSSLLRRSAVHVISPTMRETDWVELEKGFIQSLPHTTTFSNLKFPQGPR